MIDAAEARREFLKRFGNGPSVIVRAPGRVNIIGEHTDYNQGYVLPMAIERGTLIVARKRPDRQVHAVARNLAREAAVSLDQLQRHPTEGWVDYVLGVIRHLKDYGHTLRGGVEMLIMGDVPIGSGLSSSASLEMAALKLFETLEGFTMPDDQAARLGQTVENKFLGVSSGIMDQFISRCGKEGHALFLDCRSLQFEHVPIRFDDALFVIADTDTHRGLASSKYNERVEECGQAVLGMNEKLGTSHESLRDFTLEDLEQCRESLPDTIFRRARHVLTENDRTEQACAALIAGSASELGRLLNASDESLQRDYEVTSHELEVMTAIARDLHGCHGARMTGAGFGGCTINLVAADAAEAFGADLMQRYHEETGHTGEIIISRAAQGAQEIVQ